jgi:hypothetical protein
VINNPDRDVSLRLKKPDETQMNAKQISPQKKHRTSEERFFVMSMLLYFKATGGCQLNRFNRIKKATRYLAKKSLEQLAT